MEFQPASKLFLTDNAWYEMWWFVFIFHKKQVTCGGAISEVVNWRCLQHSPSKQLIAFWMSSEQRPSFGIRLVEDLGNKAWGNRAVIESGIPAQQTSWQSKF